MAQVLPVDADEVTYPGNVGDPKLASRLARQDSICAHIQLSLQRVETLTALARWEISPETATALAYQAAIHEERMLIVQDVECEVSSAFARLGGR